MMEVPKDEEEKEKKAQADIAKKAKKAGATD